MPHIVVFTPDEGNVLKTKADVRAAIERVKKKLPLKIREKITLMIVEAEISGNKTATQIFIYGLNDAWNEKLQKVISKHLVDYDVGIVAMDFFKSAGSKDFRHHVYR
ncbi:MAG: hypothetical protein PHU42_00200 [Patescibacteria group bacterium]|nr:hypothetical protein [Patescibacteria group bacterium]